MTVEAYRRTHHVGTFRMDGEPVSKERPRVGPTGTFTPKKTSDYETRIGWAARSAIGGYRLDKTKLYQVNVTLCIKGPAGWAKDVDNMCKTVLDGMNNVVYPDDKQVVVLRATKLMYPSRPHSIIEVWEVEPIEPSTD